MFGAINNLGCRRISKAEERELLQSVGYKVQEFRIGKKKFTSIEDVILHIEAKRLHKSNQSIYNEIGEWGRIKDFYTMHKED